MPKLTYKEQAVPPPMNAWVQSGASDVELLFDEDRPFALPCDDDKSSSTSRQMHELVRRANSVLQMRTQGFHLSLLRDEAKIEVANNRTPDCEFTKGQLLDESRATAAFLELLDECQKEFDHQCLGLSLLKLEVM